MSDDDNVFPYSFTKEAYAEYRRESPPPPDSTKQNQPVINLINPSADWSDDIPPLEWTVPDLIPKRQVCLFSGHGAAGKSTIALHLCVAHALGENFLNFRPEPGNALFFDAEDDELVMRHRLAAILKHYGKTRADLDGRLAIISRAGQDAILATQIRGVIQKTKLYDELKQIVAELRPRQTVIASSANVFAGNELDRTQVTQFISMLTRLAIDADGSVVLISHPSLTGMSTGSGISGSTSWHNAVRAQLYLEGVKDGEEEANGLRKLTFKKNQYGQPAASIALEWQDGMFLPPAASADYQKAARSQTADEVFEILLPRFAAAGLSPNRVARNYAPRVFSRQPEALDRKLAELDIELAMGRALQIGKCKIIEEGPASKRRSRIVPT